MQKLEGVRGSPPGGVWGGSPKRGVRGAAAPREFSRISVSITSFAPPGQFGSPAGLEPKVLVVLIAPEARSAGGAKLVVWGPSFSNLDRFWHLSLFLAKRTFADELPRTLGTYAIVLRTTCERCFLCGI